MSKASRFAEHLVANAGRLWAEGNLEQRQMIQRAIFPEGLTFDGKEVGTGVTCLAFMQLQESDAVQNGMASPRGMARVGTPDTFVEGDIAA